MFMYISWLFVFCSTRTIFRVHCGLGCVEAVR